MQAKDWSGTPLGPREEWSRSLLTLVDVVLAHPLPMILLWGPNLTQIYNDGYARIAGTKHPAALGMSTRKCWPEVWHITSPIYERVMGHGESIYLEGSLFPLARGEGSAVEDVYVNVAYAPARDDAGRIAGILVTITETTGIAPTEAAQLEVMARVERQAHVFDTVLTHINDFAYIFDRDGRFLYVNKPLLDLWGLPLEQAVGRNFFDLKYPNDLAAKLQRQIQQVIDTKRVLVDETPYTSPSGKAGYYEYIFSPVFAADGSVEVVTGSTRVITVRKELEVALNNERARLASVIEHAPAFICTLRGPDHVFELANERYYEVVGKRDIIGKPVRAALPEVEGQGFFELLDNVYRTGETFIGNEMPVLLRRSEDGSLDQRLMNLVYQALREADGSVSGIFVHGVDVTDFARSREALRASEEQRRLALESAELGSWHVDPATMTLTTDARFRDIFGVRADRLDYETAVAAIHSEDQGPVRDAVAAATRPDDPAPYAVEYRVVQPDGSVRWVFAKGRANSVGTGPERRVVSFDGTVADITDRKRAEAALRESEERYRRLVETAHEGIWTIDAEGRTTYINQRMAELLGYSPQEMMGRVHTDYMWEQDRPKGDVDMEHRREGTAEVWDQRYRRKDGSELWTVASCNTLLDARGKFVGAMGMFTDITGRKRAEAERQALLERERAAREEAESANRAKDRFLAVLSHELRTPLTPVALTAAAMEMDPGLPYEFREDVAMIRRNVELETSLIDDLLDLSRVASGKLRLNPQPTHVHDLIRNVLQMVGPELHEKQLRVEQCLAAAQDRVDADAARLQQTLWNLLKNAAKFTPAGGGIAVRTSNADGQLIIEVADTGIGIEPAALPHVFNPFEQGDAAVTRQYGGMGLGLAIAKAVVDLHGGTIRAASDGPGKGAVFAVALPLGKPVALGNPGRAEHPVGRGDRPVRLLLVEDHADSAKILVRLLRRQGTEVQWASTVAAALQLAASEPFDVVVSDLGLPDGTGYVLMKQIHERYGLKGIALSGYGMEDDVRKSQQSGFIEHLVKPVNLPQLRAAIKRVIGTDRTGG